MNPECENLGEIFVNILECFFEKLLNTVSVIFEHYSRFLFLLCFSTSNLLNLFQFDEKTRFFDFSKFKNIQEDGIQFKPNKLL